MRLEKSVWNPDIESYKKYKRNSSFNISESANIPHICKMLKGRIRYTFLYGKMLANIVLSATDSWIRERGNAKVFFIWPIKVSPLTYIVVLWIKQEMKDRQGKTSSSSFFSMKSDCKSISGTFLWFDTIL